MRSRPPPPGIVLASSSTYRAALLGHLGIAFASQAPDIDESPRAGERPLALCMRLGQQKAMAVAVRAPAHGTPAALVIGSDQVAALGDRLLGKPGDAAAALTQLRAMRGRGVDFLTSLCVVRTDDRGAALRTYCHVTRTHVRFRDTSDAVLARYVARERPFDCAGSFRSEAGGAGLVDAIETDDPSALVGLPLARLAAILEQEGVELFGCG
jgi:septum formation protein